MIYVLQRNTKNFITVASQCAAVKLSLANTKFNLIDTKIHAIRSNQRYFLRSGHKSKFCLVYRHLAFVITASYIYIQLLKCYFFFFADTLCADNCRHQSIYIYIPFQYNMRSQQAKITADYSIRAIARWFQQVGCCVSRIKYVLCVLWSTDNTPEIP